KHNVTRITIAAHHFSATNDGVAIGKRPTTLWKARNLPPILRPSRKTTTGNRRRRGSLQVKGESMVLQIHSWIRRLGALTLAMGFILVGLPHGRLQVKAEPQTRKPNIVIIWGDDVGQSDISAYSMGLMGFHTPNIDRVAKEGTIFTDYYAEQSCTAGRASFITGQCGLRTGNTKVGMPGAAQGLQARDVTIAHL